MFVSITICLLSTIAFCLSARGLLIVAARAPKGASVGFIGHHNFNMRARRIARGYTTFALSLMTLVFFASAVSAYVELFTEHLQL